MWAPSTSASVMMMIRWYRSLVMSKLSSMPSMPAPRAMISGRTFSLATILSRRAFSTLRTLPRSGSTAWKRRSRPCLAEPPAESPSTMNSSLRAGSRSWQSASLPGRDNPSRAPLRMTRSRALRAAARACRREALLDDPAAVAGVLLEVLHQAVRDRGLDLALHLGVAELGLRLALELRVRQLDADHGGETLADVVAGEVAVTGLEDAGLAGPIVERARQRGAEPGDVGAAIDGVDVVRECEDVLGVRVVVLDDDLDLGAALAPIGVDRLRVERLLVPV